MNTKKEKMTEAELLQALDDCRRSLARYENYFDSLIEGCFEVDLEGHFIVANKAACDILGYSKEECMRLSGLERRPSKEEADRVTRAFKALSETGRPMKDFEYRILTKDGRVRVVAVSATLIHDGAGHPAGYRGIVRDVTERIAMLEDLEKYQNFVENIEDGCFEVDLRGNMTFCNAAACHVFGYDREELLGMNNRAYTTAETAAQCYRLFNNVYRDGISRTMTDYEIIQKNGQVRYLEMTVSLVRDRDGRPIGFRGIDRDITERRKMEVEKAQYRDFVENIEVGCFELDLRGNMTFLNDGACRIYGYPREELLGMNYRGYTAPETAARCFKIFNEIYRSGGSAKMMDYEVIRKDGSIRWIETLASLMTDRTGMPVGFRGITQDITDRKKAETERERSRSFLENIGDSCFEIDLTDHCTFWNEATLRQLGFTADELKHITYRDYTTPEEAEKIARAFRRMYRTGQPLTVLDHQIIRKDGEIRVLEISASVVRDRAGKLIGSRGISRDVTEKKRLIERLQQAQKMEAIGTLAGGIAHDFNNLLMGIQGYTSLMLLDTDPGHPHHDKLKAIEGQVKNAALLTKQLLGYAQGGRYDVKNLDLNDVVGKTADLFGRAKKELRIHQQLAGDLWPVEADRGQLEQVLLDLFINAWQAMPGGGSLYLETRNVMLDEAYVRIYEAASGPYVKVSVTDTGVGMDEETKRRVFDPFFTTKDMGRGTGLALAAAYGIIRGHQGIITVYTEKGHGTTFHIYLPASRKAAVSQQQEWRLETAGGERTVLLVDDEKTIADVTGALLQGLGFRVLIAASGEEAVEVYRAHQAQIDVVIMDMIMPGEGGGAAIDRIHALNPEARIILSSGYSLNGEAKEIMARGGTRAFLQKPFQLAELAEKIREVTTK